MQSLFEKFKTRFPEHIDSLREFSDNYGRSFQLEMANTRYKVWFNDSEEDHYVVGINHLHQHFHSDDLELDFEEAWSYLEEILLDKITAIGIKNKETDFLIAIMDSEQAISSYSHDSAHIEIIGLSKVH